MKSIDCPVVESVKELREYKLVPNQHNTVFVKLRQFLAFCNEQLPEDERVLRYENNRGTGKVSQKTVKRVVDSYHPSSLGTFIVCQTTNGVVMADGNSRLAALLQLLAEDKLTRHQLDRLIAVQVTDELLENYVNTNAHDPHKNSNKVQNPDLLVGALARRIEEAVQPLKLPVDNNCSFYKKLETILIARNKNWFSHDIQNNVKALNDADNIWRNEMVDVLATDPSPVNVAIPHSFRMAIQRYIGIRRDLLALNNGYARKSAESIGLMAVLVIDFLNQGPISKIDDKRIVANANFSEVIGNSADMANMWTIFCDAIENVSSTRKKSEATVKHWKNIEKILNRRYTVNKASGLSKVV